MHQDIASDASVARSLAGGHGACRSELVDAAPASTSRVTRAGADPTTALVLGPGTASVLPAGLRRALAARS